MCDCQPACQRAGSPSVGATLATIIQADSGSEPELKFRGIFTCLASCESVLRHQRACACLDAVTTLKKEHRLTHVTVRCSPIKGQRGQGQRSTCLKLTAHHQTGRETSKENGPRIADLHQPHRMPSSPPTLG